MDLELAVNDRTACNAYSIRTFVSSVLLYCWIGPENHRTVIGVSFVIHVISYDSFRYKTRHLG